MKIVLSVFIGGGLGSILRYLFSVLSLRYISSGFPWGTFVSNMLACVVLAVFVLVFREKFDGNSIWKYFMITGFCGGFSTFSTFSYENYILFRSDQIAIGVLNIILSVLIGIALILFLLKDVPVHD